MQKFIEVKLFKSGESLWINRDHVLYLQAAKGAAGEPTTLIFLLGREAPIVAGHPIKDVLDWIRNN